MGVQRRQALALQLANPVLEIDHLRAASASAWVGQTGSTVETPPFTEGSGMQRSLKVGM